MGIRVCASSIRHWPALLRRRASVAGFQGTVTPALLGARDNVLSPLRDSRNALLLQLTPRLLWRLRSAHEAVRQALL